MVSAEEVGHVSSSHVTLIIFFLFSHNGLSILCRMEFNDMHEECTETTSFEGGAALHNVKVILLNLHV